MGVAEVTFPTVWERRMAYALLYHWYGDAEPTVAIGSTKSKITVAAATSIFAGAPGSIVTSEDKDILASTFTALANNQGCRILICAQSDGTVTATQGPVLTLAFPFAAFPEPVKLKCWCIYTPLSSGLHAKLVHAS